MSLNEDTRQQIDDLVRSHDVMLFMKGDRQAPQCGFSATVIQILDTLTPEYQTADVLSDPALRDGIKAFSSWPTIPQLYVKGEFIGGCDIIQELFGSGELHGKLGIQLDLSIRPTITMADDAAKALGDAVSSARAEGSSASASGDGRELHLTIDARYQATLAMAPRGDHDIEIDVNGVRLLVDALSAQRADGVRIEAVDTPRGTGFKIENPNAPTEA